MKIVLPSNLKMSCSTVLQMNVFNVNGTVQKVQKNKLQQKLTMIPVPEPEVYTAIVDMGLIWRIAASTIEDRAYGDDSKYTWCDYADKALSSGRTQACRADH